MKNILFLFLFLLISSYCSGQEPGSQKNDQILTDEETVYDILKVEVQPEFPGGLPAMMDYLRNNINYPVTAKEMGLQGKSFITFVINKRGSVVGAEVFKGVTIPDTNVLGEDINNKDRPLYEKAAREMDQEALRVVRSMPKWSPGRINDTPVKVRYILPISYKLV